MKSWMREEAIGFVSRVDELLAGIPKRLDSAESGKAILARIVPVLVGLVRRASASRIHEESSLYGAGPAG